MPIYEFECDDCNVVFEKNLKISEMDKPMTCPKCKSKSTKRIVSKIGAAWIMGYNSKNKYSKKQTEHR